MKKRPILIGIVCVLSFLRISSVWAQSYYHDDPQDIVIKKSIVRALHEQVNPDYLLTIENDLWSQKVFYTNIPPYPAIEDILSETSGFRGVHDPIVFDGDKIEKETGRRISDVPGTAIVAYDGRTTIDRTINYKEYQVIDGDKIWIETGKTFDFVPEGRIIVYDCLFHTIFNCGRRKDDRVSVFPKTVYTGGGMHRDPKAEKPVVVYPKPGKGDRYDNGNPVIYQPQYQYDDTQSFGANFSRLFKQLPWYAKIFFLLLVLFVIHLILTFGFRDWGPGEYTPEGEPKKKT